MLKAVIVTFGVLVGGAFALLMGAICMTGLNLSNAVNFVCFLLYNGLVFLSIIVALKQVWSKKFRAGADEGNIASSYQPLDNQMGITALNYLRHQMIAVDNKSVPRLKSFVAPELLTQEEKVLLDTPTFLEKLARKLFNR